MAESPSRRTDPFGSIRELIRTQLVEQVLPSLAVAVARDGEILWEEGFGWADRENRVPATEHTMYSLASISKPITATGVMVLQQQGKLDLDRPINDYLGEAKLKAWVGEANEATVRRVANHTSGLPLHYHFFPEDEPRRRPPMDETIRRYGNLVTAPGERYQYANLGYGLLDYLIARLSGRSYPDFMREQVFLPLGMTHASVWGPRTVPAGTGPGLEVFQATRYGGDGTRFPFYDFDHPGGSAVFCSAHDLIRFAMFHLKAHLPDQKAILSDETLDAMQVPTARTDRPSGYGIGWFSNDDEHGYRTVAHGGGMGGVSTLCTLIPEERLAVVALANASCDLPGRAAQEILAQLLPRYAERRAQAEAQEKDEAKQEEPVRLPPELLGDWHGQVQTYQGEVPFTLAFKESGECAGAPPVHAQLGTQLKTLVNDTRFHDGWLSGRMMGEIGTDDASHRPHHLHLDLKLRGERLNGAMIAISLPTKRLTNALAHWAELTKAPSS
jgi:CubicO group peptidase (beta-lactamase class C family)